MTEDPLGSRAERPLGLGARQLRPTRSTGFPSDSNCGKKTGESEKKAKLADRPNFEGKKGAKAKKKQKKLQCSLMIFFTGKFKLFEES